MVLNGIKYAVSQQPPLAGAGHIIDTLQFHPTTTLPTNASFHDAAEYICSFIIANYICLILIKYDNRPRMESRSFHQSIIWCDHIVVADVCHSILRQNKQQSKEEESGYFLRGCFAEKRDFCYAAEFAT